MDTGSFAVYIKAKCIYSDIAKDFEARFVTTNYELDRPLSKGKTKKVIALTKDKFNEEIMKEFAVLRAKT